jgi:hypothetical protein
MKRKKGYKLKKNQKLNFKTEGVDLNGLKKESMIQVI